MNFFKLTMTKIILTILTVLTTGFIIYFLRNFSNSVIKINEIILIILIIILFIPTIAAKGISLIIPSQKLPLDGMPGYIHPIDLNFIFFTILLLPCLYVWFFMLFSIFKIINNRLKKYLYEKYRKPR